MTAWCSQHQAVLFIVYDIILEGYYVTFNFIIKHTEYYANLGQKKKSHVRLVAFTHLFFYPVFFSIPRIPDLTFRMLLSAVLSIEVFCYSQPA